MKFAHLIEINDPLNPLIEPLSREQLWRGLVLRAQAPQDFIPWMDSCTIVEQTDSSLSRISHYGEAAIHDKVIFHPQKQVVYQVPRQKDIPPSSLTMTIEEPSPDRLFVRFEYDDGADDAADSAQSLYNDFRRSAYEEADIDTIRIIRQMAEAGQLN